MTTRIIVLAAGKGTRMNPARNQSRPEVGTAVPPQAEPISNGVNSEIPKVLIPLAGKPLLQHLMDAVLASGIDPHPAIVVGENQPLIESALGKDAYQYIRQDHPLGTGHAVACAESALAADASNIIVLYGDHPFVNAETIKNLLALHKERECALTMMTLRVKDFEDWRKPFYDFGRVIRDKRGDIEKIVEVKDATQDEREVRELNPSFFCFRASWLWPNLKLLTNDNAKREYYLTDLVRIAIDQGECIASININPLQAIGINTPEHLEIAKRLIEEE